MKKEDKLSKNNDVSKKPTVFTEDEKSAMRTRARELAAEAKSNKTKEANENEVLAAIDLLQESDRVMAKKIHEIIRIYAPTLSAKTWYGMPAYAKNDKVVCFFQSSQKFKTRYATLGFSDAASLDEGSMWPVVFALKKLTSIEEKKIIELIKKAVS